MEMKTQPLSKRRPDCLDSAYNKFVPLDILLNFFSV